MAAGAEGVRRRFAEIAELRPELAVLFAYSKMTLYEELLPSDLPDDSQLVDDLIHYFPAGLAKAHGEALPRHRLRREIIATVVTNSLVNRVGSTFVHVMKEKTGLNQTRNIKIPRNETSSAISMRADWMTPVDNWETDVVRLPIRVAVFADRKNS